MTIHTTSEDKKLNALKPAKVEIEETKGAFQLLVNKEPFFIRGAGLEFGDIKTLAKHKGNSFRTWRTNNGRRTAREILDEAHKYGLMVCMGLEVGRERHGFDYNDPNEVNRQLEAIRKEVLQLKDHPALLMWGIGNELNLRYTNAKVWDAVNDISKMIHEVDPNHLTTTSLSGIFRKEVQCIKERCPDLDVLSFQLYGSLPILPKKVRQFGWEGPYIVSEWGATGHWEVPKTSWGAPIEENSTVKAANYLKRYNAGIGADPEQCIGSYVFLWGNKQERTPTWYGMFLEDGEETEAVDVMHYIWNGSWPVHRSPKIDSFILNGKTAYENVILAPNQKYPAIVETTNYQNNPIKYRWEVLPESTDLKDGGDYEEKQAAVEGVLKEQDENTVFIKTPAAGKYRLFVYATDSNKLAATANIPFLVE
ncbi:glycoside hydrolase family 2 TIM barrel-domain containing protein [uncultured Muriicola sp.]|uniref:glycoside hydrolase family 2 TIM barrel-domain containing protein n=1 Tax=uncultured Muriicola sp. TaxID=1583102 RepID=UPI0026036759|nr:glycoside hydrolase family 2 TIM barrel-domain containing protein [uncultured Muriicola sp.]